MRHRGALIAFEGVDGSGKSTQAKTLCDALIAEGYDARLSFEPTDKGHGAIIRNSFSGTRFAPKEELRLFTLDRKAHLKEEILPALSKGTHVVLDRYYFSTAAYQGARGLNPERILRKQERFAYAPDLLVLVDISVETAYARIARSRPEGANSFEREEDLRCVKAIFDSLERPYLFRVKGDDAPSVIAAQILAKAKETINRVLRLENQ